MARQRIYQLRPGGAADDAVEVWGEPAIRSSLVSVGDPDVEARVQSTAVIRIRYRDDVTIRSVLQEGGNIWFVTETAEVGQRHWLDLSIVAYALQSASRPEDTDVYTPQTGYTLALDGAPVQYLQVWELLTPLERDAQNPTHQGRFIMRNRGAAGVIPVQAWVQAPNGALGRLGDGLTESLTITSDDEIIPEARPNLASGGLKFFTVVDRRAARVQRYSPQILDWIRILPTEEIG